MKFWVSVISFMVAGASSVTLLAWFGLPYVPLSESAVRDPYVQLPDIESYDITVDLVEVNKAKTGNGSPWVTVVSGDRTFRLDPSRRAFAPSFLGEALGEEGTYRTLRMNIKDIQVNVRGEGSYTARAAPPMIQLGKFSDKQCFVVVPNEITRLTLLFDGSTGIVEAPAGSRNFNFQSQRNITAEILLEGGSPELIDCPKGNKGPEPDELVSLHEGSTQQSGAGVLASPSGTPDTGTIEIGAADAANLLGLPVVGTALLQGRNSHQGVEVTAIFDGTVVGTGETDSSGRYQVDAVPAGIAELRFFHPGYLRAQTSVVIDAAITVDAGVVKLLGGDTNDDGVVDGNDLWGIGARLARSSRSTQTLAPVPSQSRSNGDGATLLFNINGLGPVDVLDLALLGVNFGKQEPAACPAAVAGDSGGPVIVSYRVAQHQGNVLIYDVEGTADRPSKFYVEYGNGAVGFLRSMKSDTFDTGDTVNFGRLRARTSYCYQLVAEDDQGRRSPGVLGQIATAPLPQELQDLTFTVQTGERTSYPLTIFEHNNPSFNGIVAIDDQAHLVWYYSEGDGKAVSALVQDPSTFDLLYQVGGFLGEDSAFIKEVNPLGELVRSSPEVCALPDRAGVTDETGVHHEILAPVDGKVLYIARAIADPLSTSDRLQQGDTIRQWNQITGDDRVLWDAFENLDVTGDRTAESNSDGTRYWAGCDGSITNEDWSHGNSLQVVPGRGNVIMSFRSLDMIISIAPDFGSIEWRLGGPTSDFSFPDSGDRFYHQHTASQLPNGNILTFDNGNTRPGAQGGEYSRGLELSLNTGSMTATKVWEYRHDPDLFAFCCSNTTRLTNGNTMMVFGCCFTHTLVEADSQGKTLFEAVIQAPMRVVQYRGYPADSIMGESSIGP